MNRGEARQIKDRLYNDASVDLSRKIGTVGIMGFGEPKDYGVRVEVSEGVNPAEVSEAISREFPDIAGIEVHHPQPVVRPLGQ